MTGQLVGGDPANGRVRTPTASSIPSGSSRSDSGMAVATRNRLSHRITETGRISNDGPNAAATRSATPKIVANRAGVVGYRIDRMRGSSDQEDQERQESGRCDRAELDCQAREVRVVHELASEGPVHPV